MLMEISFSQFVDFFESYRANTYSYDGKQFIYNWYNEVYPETPVDFQVLIDSWCEYDSINQFLIDNDESVNHFVLSNKHVICENI